MIAYNWWILVPLRPRLMRSPNELFSNMEVAGQPFATAMRTADMLAGVLLFAAFLLAGSAGPGSASRARAAPARAERACLLVFAAAGAAGAIFPQACRDGVSAACRRMELALRLPVTEYFHTSAGVAEFGGITLALAFAVWRTRGERSGRALTYRALAAAAVAAYPLLGLSYLADRYGGMMEAIFFTGFTIMALVHIAESTSRSRDPQSTRAGRASYGHGMPTASSLPGRHEDTRAREAS